MKRWTIRVCRKCGSHHGRLHDGCVTYSHPMFPQTTEHAGVDEVEVVPAAEVERLREALREILDAHNAPESDPDYWQPYADLIASKGETGEGS